MAPTPQEMADDACRRLAAGQDFRQGFEEGVLAERSRPPPAEPLQEWGPMPERYREPEPSPLAQTMIAISQRCHSAEWRATLARDLWRCIASRESPMPFGNGQVDRAEILNLRALASASGCWCEWSEAEGRPVDLPLGEWLAKVWNVKGGAK